MIRHKSRNVRKRKVGVPMPKPVWKVSAGNGFERIENWLGGTSKSLKSRRMIINLNDLRREAN
jgi:hypothetical protein